MRLIGLAVVVAASLALAPLAGEAQQAVKVPRVGFLIAGSSQGIQPYLVCLPARAARARLCGRSEHCY